MGKLSITSYTDEFFNSVSHPALNLPINPDKIKLSKGIQYAEDRQLGSLNGSNTYVRYQPEILSFECMLDTTSVLENDEEVKNVHEMISDIEQRLYDYNTEGHRPSYVKVEYGEIMFFGQLKTLDTEYTLFDIDGLPLRAELKVTITGYCSQKEEKSRFSKRSPDVSRLVVLKEGQTLSSICQEIYDDPLLVGQIARFNNFNGFRNIPTGTEILMPMLKKI